MSYDYDASCHRATDSQGITKIVAELAAHGITANVLQTGGFMMVAIVELGCEWFVGITAEVGGVLYHTEDSFCGGDHVAIVAECGGSLSDHVAEFVKRWRGGIEGMRATRQRVESLRAALPNDYGGEFDNGGFLYYGAHYIEDFGDRFLVTIENHGTSGTLEECEAYLYGFWVRMFYE